MLFPLSNSFLYKSPSFTNLDQSHFIILGPALHRSLSTYNHVMLAIRLLIFDYDDGEYFLLNRRGHSYPRNAPMANFNIQHTQIATRSPGSHRTGIIRRKRSSVWLVSLSFPSFQCWKSHQVVHFYPVHSRERSKIIPPVVTSSWSSPDDPRPSPIPTLAETAQTTVKAEFHLLIAGASAKTIPGLVQVL
jgi:hypothetical protein